jgi:hypothetical protein
MSRDSRCAAGRETPVAEGNAKMGRPRTSPIRLEIACEYVELGHSLTSAARVAGVSDRSLRRYLQRRVKLLAPGEPVAE